MKWMQLLLPVLVLAGPTLPAQAQLQIFNRKARLNMQVPELIVTARTDTDERRRIAAVEQLRESDPKTYPDIVPNLIEVMLHDPKYNVRMEAMHTLVKIRPMTQQVGQALAQTAAHDDNWRVRMQTKTQIFVNGYHGGGNGQNVAPTIPTTNEPPLGTGTVIGQPVYAPISGSPSAGMPSSLGRPLPSRPGYSTSSPQSVTEIPLGVQPQPTPLPQPPAQSYVPPQQQVPPQRPGPLPQPPTTQPLPQVPTSPPVTQPLPQAPAQPSLPLPPAPPMSQSAPPPEPENTPITPPAF